MNNNFFLPSSKLFNLFLLHSVNQIPKNSFCIAAKIRRGNFFLLLILPLTWVPSGWDSVLTPNSVPETQFETPPSLFPPPPHSLMPPSASSHQGFLHNPTTSSSANHLMPGFLSWSPIFLFNIILIGIIWVLYVYIWTSKFSLYWKCVQK